MAKCNLNGVTLDEVRSNASNSYAASIISGEIFSVEGLHSKNGNPMLRVIGKNLACKDFNGNGFAADGCILYNPPMIKAIIEACDDTDATIFIAKGAVSKTAPASKPTSDTVLSKEEETKEIDSKIKALQKSIAVEEDNSKIAKLNAEIASLRDRKKTLKTA